MARGSAGEHRITSYNVCYTKLLRRYLDRFKREQILISFIDDLRRDPDAYVRAVLRFIGVDDQRHVNTTARYNTSQSVGADAVMRRSGLKAVSKRLRLSLPVTRNNFV